MDDEPETRIFSVSQAGVATDVTPSPGLSKAYDVLHAAGCVTEKMLLICHAAERQGDDPVAMAHKLVSFSSILAERPVSS